jgi:hypothetical protein
MTDRYTSRVFQAGRAIYDRLSVDGSFPAHPLTAKAVVVEFGNMDPENGAEKVCIMLDPEETANAWARLSPAGRDEPMVFSVIGYSYVPNMKDTVAVWDRLEELSGAIEDVMFDRRERRVIELGFDGEVPVHRASGVKPIVFPTPEGPMGRVRVTLDLLATI